jgi:hypothetical protein
MIGVLAAPLRGWTHILAGSKSPTRQVPPPKRYGTQREGGSLCYGDGA